MRSGRAKRPMHTIIPALGHEDGRCDYSLGVMGAHFQPMGHVQLMLNLVDYGMDVQQAIDAPRVFFEGEQTVVEHGIRRHHRGLATRGHDLVMAPKCLGAARRSSGSIGIVVC